MPFRIVAKREDETVRTDRDSWLIATARARVWASEGWDVTIVVRDEEAGTFAESPSLQPA
jgi:hypothetical protein